MNEFDDIENAFWSDPPLPDELEGIGEIGLKLLGELLESEEFSDWEVP